MSTSRSWATLVLLAAAALAGVSACAPRMAPPPAVTVPKYPEFLFPFPPQAFAANTRATTDLARAWQYLQGGDLRTAERVLGGIAKKTPTFYPADAALGYVQLARRDFRGALGRFDRVLGALPGYVPALVGRAETLLGAGRKDEALVAFEAAVVADPSLDGIRRRIDVLRFEGVQDNLALARRAADEGRTQEARQAYGRAIAASPDSSFLYRELAQVELAAADGEAALQHARKAVELDPYDARALVLIAEIAEGRGDFQTALDTYQKATSLDPALKVGDRMEALKERLLVTSLPAQFRAIPDSASVTRGELAALIGVRVPELLNVTGRREAVLITDARSHWAAEWIMAVARAGVMEVYPNHTFQPNALVRRGDLGHAMSRLLNMIAARDPDLARGWERAGTRFSDLGPGHLSFPAASRAVASGVMTPLGGNTFQLRRAVTGAEAVDAVAKLQMLALKSRRPGQLDEERLRSMSFEASVMGAP
ncbi:MAG: S-layer homology domain-containing protein [Acidobacteria bacterium]|nr:S-layer homology domain-containing protein [Acidobacteriota bacterium]